MTVRRATVGDGLTVWRVTGYHDVVAALRHPDLGMDPHRFDRDLDPFGARRVPEDAIAVTGRQLLNSDPPDHDRLRRLAQPHFTRPRIAARRATVTRIAAEQLAVVLASDHADLVTDYALPIPIRTICHILGLDDRIGAAVTELTEVLLTTTSQRDPRFLAAGREFDRLLRAAASSAADAPGTGVAGVLGRAWHDGRLSRRELVSYLSLLLLAGYETTASAIATGILLLLDDPSLADRPQGLVDETLRLHPPIPYGFWRYAVRDTELAGVGLVRGDIVLASIAEANRDPGAFPDPDRLDPDRRGPGHLSFGSGLHHCLGAELGRAEVLIALTTVAPHLPRLRLAASADTLPRRSSMLFQRLLRLPVTVSPAAPTPDAPFPRRDPCA
ncbi:cytochrome P450 [Streptomyces sp. RB110-1]|uniref:cytochrome P450 n=1 Tax=unclassified Streptomyces TaxID=2593676 RepID=UPI0019019071|nr:MULTISPECIES: cytochrome P450 [unclassified Streptomyces]MBK0373087.1 cytochrome P450 [Streptomyces sp. RB110-1]MBK0390545.1 cytochrome P450 [Streptomyces sp. RB110-2]